MEEKETKPLTPPLQDLGECKVVWKEEEKTKKKKDLFKNAYNFLIQKDDNMIDKHKKKHKE